MKGGAFVGPDIRQHCQIQAGHDEEEDGGGGAGCDEPVGTLQLQFQCS